MPRRDNGYSRLVGWGALVVLGLAVSAADGSELGDRTAHRMSGSAPGKPAYLWLWYADGKVPPGIDPCSAATSQLPPVFTCNYPATPDEASTTDTTECKRRVQELLNEWYADFNLLFTFTQPPSGDYYTMVITNGWAECQDALATSQYGTAPADEAGAAPPSCSDVPGGTAIAIECGKSAHNCATIIAHEHGHLVGLEHTMLSSTDVMNSSVLPTAAGFDNQDLRTATNDSYPQCEPTQNSYREMLAALGAWPGGNKPSPFGDLPDAGAADLPPATKGADASSGGGSVGPSPTPTGIDGGVVTVVPGSDGSGLVRPRLPTVDAAATGSAGSHGGCDMLPGPADAAAPVAVIFFLLALCARRAGLGRSAAGARVASSRRPKPSDFLA